MKFSHWWMGLPGLIYDIGKHNGSKKNKAAATTTAATKTEDTEDSKVKNVYNYNYTDADDLENSVNEMFKGNMQQRRTCESLIKEFLSPEDQQLIQDTMPNVIVEMFYKVSKGLVDKYGYKEGTNPPPNKITKTSAERDAEYDNLMQQIAELSSRPHKTEEKDRLMEMLRNVYR